MEKVVVILTQKGALSRGLQNNTMINLFRLKGSNIFEVENIKMEKVNDTFFSKLMTTKKVDMIYTGTLSDQLHHSLTNAGVIIKYMDDINNDKFIEQFVFA
ncbi:MAG: hypothetical protein E6767_07575 [Dysgonomonas sp.]|nr:hypothetical protein [Dysgonomonas sp.]